MTVKGLPPWPKTFPELDLLQTLPIWREMICTVVVNVVAKKFGIPQILSSRDVFFVTPHLLP